MSRDTSRRTCAALNRRSIVPVLAVAAGSVFAFGPQFAGHSVAADTASPAQTVAAPVTVGIKNFSFNPKALTVAPGTEVVWTNNDEEPHTVTSDADPRAFKSQPLDQDDKFSFVFKEPGTYAYHCSVHPHMQGTVIVK